MTGPWARNKCGQPIEKPRTAYFNIRPAGSISAELEEIPLLSIISRKAR